MSDIPPPQIIQVSKVNYTCIMHGIHYTCRFRSKHPVPVQHMKTSFWPFFIFFIKDEGRLAASNTYGISTSSAVTRKERKKMMENVSCVAGVRTGKGQSPKTSASNNIGPPPTQPLLFRWKLLAAPWFIQNVSKNHPKCASTNQPTAIATKRKEIHFYEIHHIFVWILDINVQQYRWVFVHISPGVFVPKKKKGFKFSFELFYWV